jgi:integrase/recombinase XerD
MLREEIESFLNYLGVEKGFSENTIFAYRNDLHQLAGFAEKEATLWWLRALSRPTQQRI